MPQEYLTMPAFKPDPFGFADYEADETAFRRARSGAFHPAMAHYREVPTFCKDFSAKIFS
jgi:hypothetical protein